MSLSLFFVPENGSGVMLPRFAKKESFSIYSNKVRSEGKGIGFGSQSGPTEVPLGKAPNSIIAPSGVKFTGLW